MKKHKQEIKYIVCSAFSTLLVLILFTGFIVADVNTRKVGFCDNNSILILQNKNFEPCAITIRFMDNLFTFDFTKEYHITNKLTNKVTNITNQLSNLFLQNKF